MDHFPRPATDARWSLITPRSVTFSRYNGWRLGSYGDSFLVRKLINHIRADIPVQIVTITRGGRIAVSFSQPLCSGTLSPWSLLLHC